MSPKPDIPLAIRLAEWAGQLRPTVHDVGLARRAMADTVAVAVAARDEPLLERCASLGDAGRWGVAAHLLDFDDLHVESTSHISAVIVPAVLASGGDLRHYLAGAGVMARLGVALGWAHYRRGWHATCTAGAPGAAVAVAASHGLDIETTAHAIALAIPGAGGMQRAFGTDAKSLQVGFAVDSGVRAADLAANGARADLGVVEAWLEAVHADHTTVANQGQAIPGGLAIKLYPCCYAMQRLIATVRESFADVAADDVDRIVVTTPASTLLPLIHHRPTTGLEGKFSAEYAIATAFLDRSPDLGSFTDGAVNRIAARDLMSRVETVSTSGGDGLLHGEVVIDVRTTDGRMLTGSMSTPPGAPERPPSRDQLSAKIAGCCPAIGPRIDDLSPTDAAELLRAFLPRAAGARSQRPTVPYSR